MKRHGRRLRRAAVISLILNVLIISIVVRDYRAPDFAKEHNATKEIVTIEHIRPTPTPQPRIASKAAAPAKVVAKVPVEAVAPSPLPIPVPVHHHVLAVPQIVAKPLPAPKIVHKPELPKVVASVPHETAVKAGPHRYSEQQIAAIENNLGAAIAHDREGVNPLAGTSSTVVPTMKHYGFDASAFSISRSGLCDPVQSWQADGYNYYYLACNVHASDGTYDREAIPWPVRFLPSDDPNLGHGPQNRPIAMPLPGWHLPAGAYVADGVRQYAQEHGVNL